MTEVADIGAALQRLLAAYAQFAMERRRALGLNANEEAALLLLGQGSTAPSDLSRSIGMTTAGITNMLDRLENDGLVRREPHETDKRRVLLTLTKKGFRSQLELEAMHQRVAQLADASGAEAAHHLHEFLHGAADLVASGTDTVAAR